MRRSVSLLAACATTLLLGACASTAPASAPAGLKFGRFHGEDRYTTKESERLLRLPLYYGLSEDQVSYISGKVKEFYGH